MRWLSSNALVSGPTPPGTGVIADATVSAEAKSTSPIATTRPSRFGLGSASAAGEGDAAGSGALSRRDTSPPHEPRALYEARAGLCYDRSRTLEKIFRSRGFQTRHVFVFSLTTLASPLRALLTPGVQTHAVTEVRTSRGWLVVGTNARWLSLDEAGQPIAMADFTGTRRWQPDMRAARNAIFDGPFGFVYGLYSRHGQFFPPFAPVPDIAWSEFAANF